MFDEANDEKFMLGGTLQIDFSGVPNSGTPGYHRPQRGGARIAIGISWLKHHSQNSRHASETLTLVLSDYLRDAPYEL